MRFRLDLLAFLAFGACIPAALWHCTSTGAVYGSRPLVIVRANCAYSREAIEIAAKSGALVPVPLELKGEMLSLCRMGLDQYGDGFAKSLLPSSWLCRRLTYDATQMLSRLDSLQRVPLFVDGDEVRFVGLSESARAWVASMGPSVR